jgi:hypothetical protein
MNPPPTMTLLDRFAVCALEGLLACHSGEQGYTFQEAAQWAYQYAQAMLEEKQAREEASRR